MLLSNSVGVRVWISGLVTIQHIFQEYSGCFKTKQGLWFKCFGLWAFVEINKLFHVVTYFVNTQVHPHCVHIFMKCK